MRKLHSLSLLFLLIFTQYGNAQEHFIDGVYGRSLSPNSKFDLEDQYFQCSTSNPSNCPYPFNFQSTKLYTKLYFDDALRTYYASEWKLKVTYDIKLFTNSGSVPLISGKELSINYHPTANYTDIDLEVFQPASGQFYTKAEIIITAVEVTDLDENSINVPNKNSLPNDIHFELNLEVDRVYTLNSNQKPRVNNTGTFDSNTNEYTISWDFLNGAKEYDVEWLFVDIGNNADTDEFYIDFRNATRITTQQHFYKISMAYPRGFLIYRVRGIGYEEALPASGIYNKRVEGVWSFNERSFYKQQASNSTNLRKVPDGLPECQTFYFWNGLETNKNWQYNVVFAEDGKRKEVINFYDEILKPTQTATILNTDESAVVAMPIYDYIGRASLQALPAPQVSQGIRYYKPLHKNSAGDDYSYKDFDLDPFIGNQTISQVPNIVKPDKLSAVGNLGAGFYYSTQNTNPSGINGAFIPNAQGYPFSRTIYKNDGSGRVKAVSGVGKEYFGDNGTMQHETKFLYGSPFQEELFMLFGNNVGFAEYYEKTVAIDANGQASAAIKDLSGRVIATSLAGDAPDNLLSIDTKPNEGITLKVFLSDLNEIANQSLIVNKTLIAVGSTNYDFTYNIAPSLFDNCGVNNKCVYDLEIYLLDEYGNQQKLKYDGVEVKEIKKEAISGGSSNALPYKFSAKVSTGSYQLVKKLTLNQAAVDEAIKKWKENQTCIEKRIIDPITTCNPDCESLCEESFMTPKDQYSVQFYITETGIRVAEVTNNVVTKVLNQTEYNRIQKEIENCKEQCKTYDPTAPLMSECELKLTLLKQDMSPSGQYFDNTPDMYLPYPNNPPTPYYPTLNPNYNKNGWLNKITDQQFNTLKNCLKIDIGKRDAFFDELRNNWKPEYADVLVSLHPEWCAYQTLCCGVAVCDINSKDSTNSDEAKRCNPLTSTDHSQIDEWLTKTNFDSLSVEALNELGSSVDAVTKDEFTAQKLEDRARRFYEEYLKYKKVKEATCNADGKLYLKSPDSTGFTADGFGIRYPENYVFENFDPDNPEQLGEKLTEDFSCENQAKEAADAFITKLKTKCDLLTPIQERQLWDFVYNEYLKDCKDPAVTVDLNQAIRDYISCSSQLSDACFLEALPEQSEESCECAKINNFVIDVVQGNYPEKTYIEIVSDPIYSYSQEVQEALDIILDSTETNLKPNFKEWLANCNEQPAISWRGNNTSPTYTLASYFSCEEEQDQNQTEDPDKDCATVYNAYAQAIANAEFERLLNQKAEEYRQAYIASCLTSAKSTEKFDMTFLYNEYHYTLYYYDQAGDLVATVPPDGIYQKDSQTGVVYHDSRIVNTAEHQNALKYLRDPNPDPSSFVHTQHLMITNYQYNSLQNVITQKTPDGGVSNFWYDALGRMAVSQNANQLIRDAFSYLRYDLLGRTVEAGELKGTAMSKTIAEDITDYNVAGSGSNQLINWLNNGTIIEKTSSFYDEVNTTLVDNTHSAYQLQNNLRNRISAVAYDSNGDNNYEALTHYTYDVLGNVESLWQENKAIPLPQHKVKRLDYSYDLVSGNVNQVSFQKEKEDQFMHRYSYDADNRLVEVKTSVNDVIWETEARYFYYAHGPLAREEIGDKIVFANDYIYDIRGWITAMNSSMVDAKRDAGKDGIKGGINQNIGRDPFAFSLHYFKDHYKPISVGNGNTIVKEFEAITDSDSKDLYNGNIAKMVTSLKNLAQEPIEVMANAYRYDQLNRIKSFKPYWDQEKNRPLAENGFSSINARNEGEFYNAAYWFDGNGNIERLKRNSIIGANLPSEKMDDMSYGYNLVNTSVSTTRGMTTTKAKVNNQLFEVQDAITTAGYDIDIESGQTANNYKYDEIGRLISDKQENISQINWNVSNKVVSFIQDDKDPDVMFSYGPMGNRIGKLVKAKDPTSLIYDSAKDLSTYYMLDAQGNPIAIYKYDASTQKLTIEDFILYGNKRLGINTQNKTMN